MLRVPGWLRSHLIHCLPLFLLPPAIGRKEDAYNDDAGDIFNDEMLLEYARAHFIPQKQGEGNGEGEGADESDDESGVDTNHTQPTPTPEVEDDFVPPVTAGGVTLGGYQAKRAAVPSETGVILQLC